MKKLMGVFLVLLLVLGFSAASASNSSSVLPDGVIAFEYDGESFLLYEGEHNDILIQIIKCCDEVECQECQKCEVCEECRECETCEECKECPTPKPVEKEKCNNGGGNGVEGLPDCDPNVNPNANDND